MNSFNRNIEPYKVIGLGIDELMKTEYQKIMGEFVEEIANKYKLDFKHYKESIIIKGTNIDKLFYTVIRYDNGLHVPNGGIVGIEYSSKFRYMIYNNYSKNGQVKSGIRITCNNWNNTKLCFEQILLKKLKANAIV